MPTQDYENREYERAINAAKQKEVSVANRVAIQNRRAEEYAQAETQRKIEKKNKKILKRLQRKAPLVGAAVAIAKKGGLFGFARGLSRQVDMSTDWLFLILGSFGLLKDIVDIIFTGLGAIPIVGIAGAAVGFIMSFVDNILFLTLTVTILVLSGSSIKNRGAAKYFLSTALEFIFEALPGISLLPGTVVYVFILYLCVLYDRMTKESEGEKAIA